MKPSLDCFPCFVNQALTAARRFTDDVDIQERIVKETLAEIGRFSLNQTSPEMGATVGRIVAKAVGRRDLYKEEKKRFNNAVIAHLPVLRRRIAHAPDPFEAAVRIAVAGNLIDFTAPGGKTDEKLEDLFNDALSRPLSNLGDADVIARLKRTVQTANRILYLADNAGEIVADRLLIEQLPKGKVTVVVRGAPVANDALLEDARDAGLDALTEIIDNGLDLPGTLLSAAPKSFVDRFNAADLIISKGQGNFETLDFDPGRLFFLFVIKCTTVATYIGGEMGESVVIDKRGGDNGHMRSD